MRNFQNENTFGGLETSKMRSRRAAEHPLTPTAPHFGGFAARNFQNEEPHGKESFCRGAPEPHGSAACSPPEGEAVGRQRQGIEQYGNVVSQRDFHSEDT